MFDWFATYFGQARSLCSDIASRARSIFLLGSYFAYPFDSLGWAFANLQTAAQYASSWADGIVNTANAAYSKAIAAYNYSYGWLTGAVNNALTAANNAYNYAKNTVYNLANSALTAANQAYSYAINTLKPLITSLTTTFWAQVNALYTTITGAVAGIQTQINGINAWKNSIISLIPTVTTVRDWVEASLGYYITQGIKLVTDNARTYADPAWQMLDAIVGKLTEWEAK